MKDFAQIINLLEYASHYYIICTNMDGNYSYINTNYATKFGHINNNFVGKPFHITMHPDDVIPCTNAAIKCLEDKDALVPVLLRKHDGAGGYIITQWEYKGIFDENGNPEGVFCLGYDITDFIDQLAKKNSLLDAIAFSQSHVIRKPVANIMGVVDILKNYDLPGDGNELMDVLSQNVDELDLVIREISNNIHPPLKA